MALDHCTVVTSVCLSLSVAIATAAMDMLAGDMATKMSRKPEIMADAAYAIITKTNKDDTGKFLVDEDVLKEEGVKDFEQYACCPGECKDGVYADVNR